MKGTRQPANVVSEPGRYSAVPETVWSAEGCNIEARERATAPEISANEAEIVRFSDVSPTRVEWLWAGRIPLGKITVLDGDPGLGKSTMTLDLAARVTRGRPFPDGASSDPADVLIMSAEDSPSDTIRPRLDAAGADVTRVRALLGIRASDGPAAFPSIEHHIPQIERAIRASGVRLVVVDPLMAYLGKGIDSYRDQDVRRALAPLAKVADETGASVVLVRHLTKGGGSQATYRGGGSIGIIGAARSGLLVAKDPEDETRRILASVKSNLSAAPAALAFRLEDAGGVARVRWEPGQVDMTAERLLAASMGGDEERSALIEAKEWLASFLSDGPRPSGEVFQRARRTGVSEKTLRRASQTLGVEKRRTGFGAAGWWSWALPAPKDGQESPKVAVPTGGASMDTLGYLRAEDAGEKPVEPPAARLLL